MHGLGLGQAGCYSFVKGIECLAFAVEMQTFTFICVDIKQFGLLVGSYFTHLNFLSWDRINKLRF